MNLKRHLFLLIVILFPCSLFGNTLEFPQVVSGAGYSTTFVIVNTGTSAISSTLKFYYQGGLAGQYQALTDQIARISSAAAAVLPSVSHYSPAQRAAIVSQLQAMAAQAGATSQFAAQLSAQIRAVDIQIAATGQITDAQRSQLQGLGSLTQSVIGPSVGLLTVMNSIVTAANAQGAGIDAGVNPVLTGASISVQVPAGGSGRFTLPDTGSLVVAGSAELVVSGTADGYARIQLDSTGGSIVTTAAIPAVDAGNRFVLPVEVGPASSTGVAIATIGDLNPVNVTLRLLREDGSLMAAASDVRFNPVGSRMQVADFVTGIFPQFLQTTFKGTLVVEASAVAAPNSLAAAAISMKEGLLSALPAPAGSSRVYFPQVVTGGGYSTSFVIQSTGSTGVSAVINFYDQSGTDRAAYATPINMPAGGSMRFTLPDIGPLQVLWGELAASSGTVTGTALFEFRDTNGVLLATGGVPGVPASNSFVFPVDVTEGAATGFAIANVKAVPLNLRVRLIKEDGSTLATAADIRLSPLTSRHQIADFVTNSFPQIAGARFEGTLILDTVSGDTFAAMAITMIRRGTAATAAGNNVNATPPAIDALPRDLTSSEQKLIDAADTFSLALWAKINRAQPGANVLISPLSASFALGMTMNGAAGGTLTEMRNALQVSGMTEQEINEGYRSLIALLSQVDPGVTMQIANSIWYRNEFSVLQPFLDAGRQYFAAEIQGLNFNDTQGALKTINGWVDSKTNHKIPTILDDIKPENVMFLINAMYFNANWRNKFNTASTYTSPFQAAGGLTQSASLMHREAEMSYFESPAYQAVDLPYGNSAFTMTVILPKTTTDVETVAASLTTAEWQSLTRGLHDVNVDLSLPKLKLSYGRLLKDDLQSLGMTSAFREGADFSRMSKDPRLYLSFVTQKTFVDINEEGTEAAAVTIVGPVITCVCSATVMRVDRPYIFAIRERLSGTLLFMGKIAHMPD